MVKNIWIFGLLLAIVLTTLESQAQYGAISTATAGSGRATIEPSESPFLNPAAIAYNRGYFVTSDYGVMQGASEFSVGLSDNLPDTLVPAAFMYNQVNGTDPTSNQQFTTQDLHLDISNLVRRDFAAGLSIRSKSDLLFQTQYRQTNVMFGSIWVLTPNIGVALVLDNLLKPDATVPEPFRLTPSAAVGINYNYKKVIRFRFDVETASNDSLNGTSFAAGIEGHWNQWSVFRMGVRKDLETNTDEYGAGIGFSGPKFAFHYGYLMSPEQQALNRQAVDLAVPIW